jgi:amidase
VQLSEYVDYDATGLADLVRRGEVTANEVLEAAWAAHAADGGRLGAVVERYDDVVAEPASPDAPFCGVPFLMKDAGAAQAGRRQEYGSRLLRGRVSPASSHLARSFDEAGLLTIGRSAAPEFSLALCTDSLLHGPTRNPWDPERSAGGSSGGAAAAVAAGIVPLAHATDAAGSIRIPASACGCVGLKPSRGRVSHGPEAGEPLMGMDTQFAIGRSVRDMAALLDAVSRPFPGDPAPLPPPARPFAEGALRPPSRLRIGWTRDAWGGFPTHPEVAAATERCARLLEALGHDVERVDLPLDYDAFVDAALTGWALGFDDAVAALAHEAGRTLDEDLLEPVTRTLLEHARQLQAADVARAERTANRLRRSLAAPFADVEVVLTPTLLQLPEPLGTYALDAQHPSFEAYFRHCDRSGAFLPPYNLAGNPALSLPLAWSSSGLPIGLHLVARHGDELTLLQLATLLEAALPWRDRRPSLHVLSPPTSNGAPA